MKLFIIIPAYNEQESIGKVIREIPRNIRGIEEIKILVINDGSTDNTIEVANQAGADYIISNLCNRGLAYSFRRGVEEALRLGTDIIVNTDADFQYNQTEIPKLIQPIIEGEAEMVIGNRQIRKLTHMKLIKKYGNLLLSWIMRRVLNNEVSDASSGFRAFSRECALRLNIFSPHTYTHETIIQCTLQKMRIKEVPIKFRKREDGESRLIRSLWDHIKLSGSIIIRMYLIYNPLKTFLKVGVFLFLIGLFFESRYLWFYFYGQGQGHFHSVILGLILMIVSVQIIAIGFLADLIDTNRKREEEILYRLKKKEYKKYKN